MVEQINTHEELKSYETGDAIFESRAVTPDDVRQMKHASEKLFCKLADNTLITFGNYSIRDYESGQVLVEVPEDMQEYAH
jgi:protein unc-119